METKRINIEMPEITHRQMKVAAATKGLTIQEWVIQAIAEKCQEQQRQSQ